MAAVGSTSPTTGSPPPISLAEPSNGVKRTRSESSDSKETPPSKRPKIEEQVVLDKNCGDFYLIPSEVVNYILSCCKASALVRMGTTCKHLLYLADRAPMWAELCRTAKLSVKEGASYRLEFLSAMAGYEVGTLRSAAEFFSAGRYTAVNRVRALACWDLAIDIQTFWNGTAVSRQQGNAVLGKANLFFTFEGFQRSAFAFGQIETIYSQLTAIIAHSKSKDVIAKARLFQIVMKINDHGLGPIDYSSIWNALNAIERDEQVEEQTRDEIEYMLALLPYLKADGRWVPADLAQFRQNQGGLSDSECVRILKKCVADNTTFLWCRQLAKAHLARMRLEKRTEEITDQQAYEMLESLCNSPDLIRMNPPDTLQDCMKQFKDQKRV